MKRILLSFIAIAIATLSSFGQSPEGFKYQAVIRDAGNLILTNQAVGMQLTIQQGSIGGTAVYTEAFSPTSNAFGLVNLEIGTGMSTDDFTIIDWANGPYFMETAVDITGGMTYEVMGTSQLMSVPYALYAKTSGNGEGPQGPTGAAGAVGAQGPAGENGNDGVPGPQGLQGPAGADSTVPGPTGPAGTNGIDGIDGDDGAQGIQGLTGSTGPTGPAGADSTVPGPAGADGINGQDGIDGAQGPQGLQGPAGADSTVPGPAGADGINGQDGIDGAQGIQGPAGENGINGPDGITGAQGPQGLTGPAGTNGIDGIDGDDGAQGSTGLTGPAGANGNDGADGATGLQGPIGLTGPAGANGTNGNDGATGSDGQDGDDGITGQSAYDVWISLGNTGGEADFIASLTGPQGNDGVVDYDSLANIISVDSSFTANVSGSIGGGCDFSFPEGLDGEVITVGNLNLNIGYTVPSGKKLYILNYTPVPASTPNALLINGINIGSNPNYPLILNPGDVLNGSNGSTYVSFNGFLTDSSPTITAVSDVASLYDGYTVPSGKKLYIFTHASAYPILINGINIGSPLNDPIILNPGDVLNASNTNGVVVRFNGYLADENYFAGCGGGSSNSASNATIDSLSQVVSTLDSTLTALTSLFVFGCMDPAAFNYNSSANINDGSCNFIPSIGDTYQGGIIFYLDGNGGGLIAAPSNQSSGASEWGCIGTSIGTGTAIGSGFQNTAMIELGCATPNTAADVCANLTLGGYNDWFLPSRYELVEMHQNIGQGNALGLGNIGGFANNYYWSSSEAFGGSSTAWIKYFGITTSGVNSWNKDELEYVRAIRVF
jgi:hypothetical protein